MPTETPITEQSATKNESEGGATPPGSKNDGPDSLGEGGIKALQAERQRADSAEKSLKAFTELGLTVEQVKAMLDKSNEAPSFESIREQARRDAETAIAEKFAASARAAEVRAQAVALGFHNPADVLAFIPAETLTSIKVTDDGEADVAAVKSVLEALATDKSYLVKPQSPSYRDAGIGASGGTTSSATEPGLPRLRQAYANTK